MILKLCDYITIENVSYQVFFDKQRKPFVRKEGKITPLKDYTLTSINGKYFGVKKHAKDLKKFKAWLTVSKETLSYEVFAESLASAKSRIANLYAKEKRISIALAQNVIKNLGSNFKIEEAL